MGKPPATRRDARSAEIPQLGAVRDGQFALLGWRDAFGFKVLIMVNALAMGALADIGMRLIGLKLPPIFTIGWGAGAVLLIALASAANRRRLARDAEMARKPQLSKFKPPAEKAPPKSRAA